MQNLSLPTAVTAVRYSISAHRSSKSGALVDRGANGGVAGHDVHIIFKTGRHVDVRGINDHQIVDIPIVACGGVIFTQRGPVTIIMHQYAYTGKEKTIHLCGQLEWYKNDVNDKLIKVPGGLHRIQTNDGYAIPINIKDGLPYVQIRPYTDEEWDALPHVILTSNMDWDPTVLDHTRDDDDKWFDAVSDLQNDLTTNLSDEFRNYRKHSVVVEENATFFDTITVVNEVTPEMPNIHLIIDDCILHRNISLYEAHAREVKTKEPNYDTLHPLFGWLPVDVNKRTFAATTQYAGIPMSTTLKNKHYKSPFPAVNVHHRDEPIATADTVHQNGGIRKVQYYLYPDLPFRLSLSFICFRD
jgi:hypothetical protein